MKLYYETYYNDILVGELITNQSIDIDYFLEMVEFNENEFMSKHNLDDIDYNNFKIEMQ